MLFGSATRSGRIHYPILEQSDKKRNLVHKQRDQSRDLGNLPVGIEQMTPPLKLGFVGACESVGKPHLFHSMERVEEEKG